MIANIGVVAISVVLGSLALLPLRRSLPAALFHLAAFPAGVLLWSFVPALTSVTGTVPGPMTTAAGLALGTACVAVVAWLFAGEPVPGAATARSYAVFGGAAAAATALFAAWGITQVGFDSYSHYELSAWYLADTGHVSEVIISSRNLLIPALHVGNRVLGADWLYLVYPLFATTALALLAWALWEHSFSTLSRAVRAGAIALVCAAVALIPIWTFHTWLVHSNMVSAMYMALAVLGILAAAGMFDRANAAAAASSPAAALLGGIGIAGLALARPDGLAYAFQGLALLGVCHVAGSVSRKSVLAAYAGFLVPVLAVYGSAFATLGFWRAEKLQGMWVAALLGAILVFGAATLVLGRVKLPSWLTSEATLVRIAVLANVLVVAFVARERFKQFFEALRNMAGNLLVSGGWGLAWYVIGFGVLLSLLFPLLGDRARWQRLVGYATFQFFAVAVVVHGMVHPGRISTKDSFNRVALHVVPIVVWYVASYAGGLIAQGLRRSSAPGATIERIDAEDTQLAEGA